MKKLDETELNNVSGGACTKHELVECAVFVTYQASLNKNTTETLKVRVYADTNKLEDGRTIEQFCNDWCKERGFLYKKCNDIRLEVY